MGGVYGRMAKMGARLCECGKPGACPAHVLRMSGVSPVQACKPYSGISVIEERSIMRSVRISLPTVGVVQRFVEIISALEGNFDILSGEYIIDARSLMGIFTLDLSSPIELAVERDTPETMRAISRFIID